ncbi:hypothetical protein H103_04335 [Trichophyton rubrum CBS 288.86]|uniref:Uncharacterized protein n=1 Tax=Trichophyton rubrum CBS 288.86 TaxID=1215330 RepID=A0A022W2W2_TRIRU|nr:hypothetical protein H103_04335 [Trichophyton rubrum CBS 288.86]
MVMAVMAVMATVVIDAALYFRDIEQTALDSGITGIRRCQRRRRRRQTGPSRRYIRLALGQTDRTLAGSRTARLRGYAGHDGYTVQTPSPKVPCRRRERSMSESSGSGSHSETDRQGEEVNRGKERERAPTDPDAAVDADVDV